jgi:site-specific DNA recombinase
VRRCGKTHSAKVHDQYAHDLLKSSVYAGQVHALTWGITHRQGQHEGLISAATYARIQERLSGNAHAPARVDIRADFPLRGAIECAECGSPLTACWSKSQTGKKHAYYMCVGVGCSRRRKSVRREQIESGFTDLLERMTPSQNLLDVAAAMFRKAWDSRAAQAAEIAKSCKRDAIKLQAQIDALLDRLIEATESTVIRAYEKKIAELSSNKLALQEHATNIATPKYTFDEMFEPANSIPRKPLETLAIREFRMQEIGA